MYFFYAGHHNFSYSDFGRFLFKRWARLSPAFYAATIVFVCIRFGFHQNAIPVLATSALYLNSIFTQYSAAGHLWTLGTEWQFYLLIPFILIYQGTMGFTRVFLLIFGTLFLFSIVACLVLSDNEVLALTDQIPFRAIEFGFGIIAARLVLKNYLLTKNRFLALLLSIIIAFAGRLLISKAALSLSPQYYNIIRLFGFTFMGAGFAGILYLAVTSQGMLNKFLSNRVFKTMGKISYSFYLWHGLAIELCTGWVLKLGFHNIISPLLITLSGTLILYPMSMISYRLLEKPFLSVGNLTTK